MHRGGGGGGGTLAVTEAGTSGGVPGLAAFLPMMHAAAVMVNRRLAGANLQATAGVVRGAPVHASPLHDLHGEEERHGDRGETWAERPRGTGQHGTMIKIETGQGKLIPSAAVRVTRVRHRPADAPRPPAAGHRSCRRRTARSGVPARDD